MIRLYKYLAKRYSVVSFDIFDTIIGRKVSSPSKIFAIVGKNVLGEEYANFFKKNRILAENEARRKKKKEIRLVDIYDELKQTYGDKTELLMAKEIDAELENCFGIKKMIKLAADLKDSGKKVILISDMYLPKKCIEKMLKRCGMTYYEELFVSNECEKVKADGQLFIYAAEKMRVDVKKMVHFGDSIRADYLGARKAGLFSVITHRRNRILRLVK